MTTRWSQPTLSSRKRGILLLRFSSQEDGGSAPVKNPVTAKISKISLIVFVVVLVFIPAVATISGRYWPYYAFASALALVPVFVGPRRYRLLGAGALLVSVVLIFHDIAAGKHFRAQYPEIQWSR